MSPDTPWRACSPRSVEVQKEENHMGRRKRAAAPFSLFAFQDIITSVTGLLLLITMLMAVDLVQNLSRAAAAPQEQKSTQVAKMLRQAVSDGTSELDRLQKLLDETTTIRFNADSLRRRLAEMKAIADAGGGTYKLVDATIGSAP